MKYLLLLLLLLPAIAIAEDTVPSEPERYTNIEVVEVPTPVTPLPATKAPPIITEDRIQQQRSLFWLYEERAHNKGVTADELQQAQQIQQQVQQIQIQMQR